MTRKTTPKQLYFNPATRKCEPYSKNPIKVETPFNKPDSIQVEFPVEKEPKKFFNKTTATNISIVFSVLWLHLKVAIKTTWLIATTLLMFCSWLLNIFIIGSAMSDLHKAGNKK